LLFSHPLIGLLFPASFDATNLDRAKNGERFAGGRLDFVAQKAYRSHN
jgi:hypothetical protein